jgi:hypothetical protein
MVAPLPRHRSWSQLSTDVLRVCFVWSPRTRRSRHAFPACSRHARRGTGADVGVARRPATIARAPLHRSGNAVRRRTPWNRHPRAVGRRVCTRRRRRPLLGCRCGSTRALDQPRGWSAVELRAGDLHARGGRGGVARRRRGYGAVGSLLDAVPALRSASRWRVRVAARVARRDPALGAPADAAASGGWSWS